MKISIAKSAGFCVGVKRAIKIALETAKDQGNFYMLGDIVHNEDVARQLNEAGIKKVKKLNQTKGGIFLIRAHGISLKTIQKAKGLGYKIVDATCPMVKEIHQIARRLEQKGYPIIVIGDENHDEVKGITGQLKKQALVISHPNDIPFPIVKRIKKAAIVVQSTQDIVQVLKIVKILKHYIKNLQFHNTICQPTQNKQNEIKTLALRNKLMIVVGSRTSANTKRLYQIAKSLNQQTFWVQSEKELKPQWLKGKTSVGITSGSSTPDATTQAVIKKIRRYALR